MGSAESKSSTLSNTLVSFTSAPASENVLALPPDVSAEDIFEVISPIWIREIISTKPLHLQTLVKG
jgi:hypothetical protein